MGTWGVHSFENDVAKEWATAYREMGLPVAKSTIDVALGDGESGGLSADLACRAIAAVEAVAFALGRGSQDAAEAFSGAPDADTAEAAELTSNCDTLLTVIENGSELGVLWSEAAAGHHEAWTSALNELRARVTGGADAEPDAPAPEAHEPAIESASGTTVETQLAHLRAEVSALSSDVEAMRSQMNKNFARLAKIVEATKR